MVAPFRYDRTFDFDVARGVLWDALTDTEHYSCWWPWLREFDSPALTAGAVAHCAVRAPLPYTLEFTVHIVSVDPGRSVETEVRGDLAGPARLTVADAGTDTGATRSTARLAWEVELRVPMLAFASRIARPLLVWAHDQIVATGVESFRRQALAEH